jgi:glycine/D-amino acid oxidase-like deaminating enzyme
MVFPGRAQYVIVGAGIHGLSTAYHLALELKERKQGEGRDIVVLDKIGVGAGASGIACGVIRNNYFQPAMRELMAHSVEVWDSDPETYSYHPVGYMQISPESMHEGVTAIATQQKDIGYDSEFIEGEAECTRYMQGYFEDWQAKDITSVLHEKRGGYANNVASMKGLAAKAEREGVRIFGGVEVTGFESSGNEIQAVVTDQGRIECGYVVVSPGPWAKHFWGMLELPEATEVNRDGDITEDTMWTYWIVRETTLDVDPKLQKTSSGDWPPVLHVDSEAPLYSDADGSLITDQAWGVYYKPDYNFGGVQGGTAPRRLEDDPDDVKVDPYGPEKSEYVVDEDTKLLWASALAHCQKRFEGQSKSIRAERSGGIGAFTPDSFPVFDVFRENCYMILDSNHGYKMIGVGKLVAGEVCGEPSTLLKPFRFSRYKEGKLHPTSNSPFPWS